MRVGHEILRWCMRDLLSGDLCELVARSPAMVNQHHADEPQAVNEPAPASHTNAPAVSGCSSHRMATELLAASALVACACFGLSERHQ
jgi:hypothetical protein